MSRPRKDIDEEQVYSLASRAWTNKDIAYYFKISDDTLVRHFAETLRQAHADRDGSLRGAQYDAAMKGNTTMMIWLGKQLLGQREKIEMTEVNVAEAINYAKRYANGRVNGHLAGTPGVSNGSTEVQ